MSLPDVIVPVRENTDVAQARRVALGVAHEAGLDENGAGTVGIVTTEAATNLLKHGGGGEIVVRRAGRGAVVELLAIDRGKGMADIERCLEDGYSTAGSPGNGLGAIRRLALHFDCFSAPDQGTVLLAQIGARAPGEQNGAFEVGATRPDAGDARGRDRGCGNPARSAPRRLLRRRKHLGCNHFGNEHAPTDGLDEWHGRA